MATATAQRIDLFRIPTRILFGRGVSQKVAEPLQQVGAKRVRMLYRRDLEELSAKYA